MLREYHVEYLAGTQYLLRLYVNIYRLPLGPAVRLVEKDSAVRRRVTLSPGAGGQQDRRPACGLPDADCRDVAADVPDGVIDGLSLIHISEPTRLGMISYA